MLLENITITKKIDSFHSRPEYVEIFFEHLPSSHKLKVSHPEFSRLMGVLAQAFKEKKAVEVEYTATFEIVDIR